MSTEPGPRDHLITRALERLLTQLDAELIEHRPLDPVEAPDRLARHLAEELRRELAGSETSGEQAERVNQLLGRFVSAETHEAAVALPARILNGIRGRSPLGQPVDL